MDEPLFSIGEAAAMVGLPPPTIRSWERRHLLLHPRRSRGNQRRYSLGEVEILKRMKDLSARGLPLRLSGQAALGEVDLSPPTHGVQSRPLTAGGGGVWRAVADLLPRLMVILDGRGVIVDCNRAFAEAIGLHRDELRGSSFADLVHPQHRAKAVQLYRRSDDRLRDWELNLAGFRGTRLLRFETWPVDYREQRLTICAGAVAS